MQNPMNQLLKNTSKSAMPNNPILMLAEFRKFAQGMTPQNAKAEVEKLLQSGQMSQQQFEELKQQAESFASFLK
nr:MAG TPA: hypothetical protein [Caudoviricetes sp.]DAW47951.1 MAG TPA: hypothetical protein [Caudoviricetes sp.]